MSDTALRPDTDDTGWTRKLHGYGTRFYVLGPVPNDVDIAELDSRLAQLRAIDPATPVPVGDRSFTWQPYDFSWRSGKEGNPGHQGYHGLKRKITDDFLCLGRQVPGLNEMRFVPEEDGGRYYVWTAVTVAEALQAEIATGDDSAAGRGHTSPILQPAAVYLDGASIPDLAGPVSLAAGRHPMLVRYDRGGRGHFVVRRHGAPAPWARTKLAMRWYDDPAVLPFDVHPEGARAEWFRFRSAPGTTLIHVTARGQVQAWLDGTPMHAKGNGRFAAATVPAHAAVVALRVVPQTGWSGGAALFEPIQVETDGSGRMALGDWSALGILHNYSGGVRYHNEFPLTAGEAGAAVELDLGRVCATAEVWVNGDNVGVRVAPPWTFDLSGRLEAGVNTIEVLVYNTLANHYQTIPSLYRGDPVSGLLGPVRLLSRDEAFAGVVPREPSSR